MKFSLKDLFNIFVFIDSRFHTGKRGQRNSQFHLNDDDFEALVGMAKLSFTHFYDVIYSNYSRWLADEPMKEEYLNTSSPRTLYYDIIFLLFRNMSNANFVSSSVHLAQLLQLFSVKFFQGTWHAEQVECVWNREKKAHESYRTLKENDRIMFITFRFDHFWSSGICTK